MNKYRWIKALFSPFKPFKLKWYVGKTQVGVPYFLPRKWVKATPRLATIAALKAIEQQKKWNEQNPNHTRKVQSFEEAFQQKIKCEFAVPLKIGFSSCGLGWKTKWSQYDIRHEWNPVISFVFFGYQIAVIVAPEHDSYYWESWICYEYMTDKNMTKQERIAFCREKCPQTWTFNQPDGKKGTIDYYELILKPKYLNKL